MARLPSEQYLMQQESGVVRLFEDLTERPIAWFYPDHAPSVETALEVIRHSALGDEDRCFAFFWAGYFCSYASPEPCIVPEPYIAAAEDDTVVVSTDGVEIVRFDPSDANAATRAQKAIYDSVLSPYEKSRAHFWSGYFYGLASGS